MQNMGMIMQLLAAKTKFEANHPKVIAFGKAAMNGYLEEGCVIDVTITNPSGESISSNMKITAEDLELVASLKGLAKQ